MDKLCVSKLCVSKWYDIKVCVSKWCDEKLCVTGGGDEEATGGGGGGGGRDAEPKTRTPHKDVGNYCYPGPWAIRAQLGNVWRGR